MDGALALARSSSLAFLARHSHAQTLSSAPPPLPRPFCSSTESPSIRQPACSFAPNCQLAALTCCTDLARRDHHHHDPQTNARHPFDPTHIARVRMAGQSNRRWGVTDPISRAPPTDAELALDVALLDELRSQNTFEAPEETEKRYAPRQRHGIRADDMQRCCSTDSSEGRRRICSPCWLGEGSRAVRYRQCRRQDLHLR